jgi:hypothetical protein
MGALQRTRDFLIRDKGFADLGPAPGPPLDGSAYALVRPYFGSPVVVIAYAADALSEPSLEEIGSAYWSLLGAMRSSVPPDPGGLRQACGQLWLFHERACPEHRLRSIRGLTRRRVLPPTYLLPWVFDLPAGRLVRHRGLPYMRWPATRSLTSQLRPGERAL